MTNLELYKVFYEVATKENITKASNSLCISQPAVTKHIQNLENDLGVNLFIRTKKGVVLSEYGKNIFFKVKKALNLFDEIETDVSEYQNLVKGTINIGISTTLSRKYLLPILKKFLDKYPNIILNIDTDPTKKLIEKLKNGKIDFIISKFPSEKNLDLEYTILNSTKYIFVANYDYKEIINSNNDINELIKYPIIVQNIPSNSRNSIDNLFKKSKINLKYKMQISSSSLLIDFVKNGYGIGYVTKLYVEKELKNKELFEINTGIESEKINYGIINLKHNSNTLCSNKLLKYIKKEFNL